MSTFPTLRARVIEDYVRENLLSGDECSKREILIKLLTKTDHSINFLAYVTECSMAYVRKIKKSLNTSLTQ
jgi:hypothetical protein